MTDEKLKEAFKDVAVCMLIITIVIKEVAMVGRLINERDNIPHNL